MPTTARLGPPYRSAIDGIGGGSPDDGRRGQRRSRVDQPHEIGGKSLVREPRLHVRHRRRPERRPAFVVNQQPSDAIGQRHQVGLLDQVAGLTVLDDF
jgi:hypothetical protein